MAPPIEQNKKLILQPDLKFIDNPTEVTLETDPVIPTSDSHGISYMLNLQKIGTWILQQLFVFESRKTFSSKSNSVG